MTKYNTYARQLDAAFKTARAECAAAVERILTEFGEKRKALRRALEADVRANPDAIDDNALELLKSGAMTVDDYFSFAERYKNNATMLRVISKYALDASENADAAAALRILSDNCKTRIGTVLQAWNELEEVAAYCSDPKNLPSMGKWWEELTGQAIEDF